MKKTTATLVLSLGLFFGCEEEIAGPQINIDNAPVNLLTTADLVPVYFDMQVYNTGQELLEIKEVTLRGDPSCAFRFQGPDRTELAEGQAAFIRGWLESATPGDYHAAVVIESNSEENPQLVVSICGRVAAAGTALDDSMYIPLEQCTAPAESDPVCAEDRLEEPVE